MKTLTKVLLLIIAGLHLLSCTPNEENISPTQLFKRSIVGDWVSIAVENNGATYTLRELSIRENTWRIKVKVFGDANATFPLFELDYEGPYEITAQSRVVPNAFEGRFAFEKKYLTLRTSNFQIIQSLGFVPCGLEVGVKTDISSSGCSFVESVEECHADYDLISLENNILYPGKRTDDMCEPEGRPIERGFAMNRK
jgi:hypothetical protein